MGNLLASSVAVGDFVFAWLRLILDVSLLLVGNSLNFVGEILHIEKAQWQVGLFGIINPVLYDFEL